MDSSYLKRWEGAYSFLSSTYDGALIAHDMAMYVGASFQSCVVICSNGRATGYTDERDFENFGRYIRTLSKEQLSNWVLQWKTSSDMFLAVAQKIPSTAAEYEVLRQLFAEYASYHGALKVALDFLIPEERNTFLPVFTEARVYTEHTYTRAEDVFSKFYEQIAHASGRELKDILLLSKEELHGHLNGGAFPDRDTLLTREFAVLAFTDDSYRIMTGEEARNYEIGLLGGAGNLKELKGTSAYPGRVSGTVRVVTDPTAVSVFNDGDILVTAMTRPEFISLIQKSAAFITDGGGILSHAAVTARELKKPCITGTKNASTLLHDGDRVDVDADSGIVRVIEKN